MSHDCEIDQDMCEDGAGELAGRQRIGDSEPRSKPARERPQHLATACQVDPKYRAQGRTQLSRQRPVERRPHRDARCRKQICAIVPLTGGNGVACGLSGSASWRPIAPAFPAILPRFAGATGIGIRIQPPRRMSLEIPRLRQPEPNLSRFPSTSPCRKMRCPQTNRQRMT